MAIYIGDKTTTSLADKTYIEKYGISELLLMENAGQAAFDRIIKIEKELLGTNNEELEEYITNQVFNKICILCASGNNGGDGFVLARKLDYIGRDVEVLLLTSIDKMTESALANYKILTKLGIKISHYKDLVDSDSGFEYLVKNLNTFDLLIDAVFGVGINRPIKDTYKSLFNYINFTRDKKKISVISIDIPSGLDPDIGLPVSSIDNSGDAIMADYTISFDYFKKGFINYKSEIYTGRVYVEELKCKKDIQEEIGLRDRFIYENDLKFEKMNSSYHKGDFGRVCIFAGSEGFYGAARLAVESAVSAGAGLVTLVTSQDVQSVLATNLFEAMTCSYDDEERLDQLVLKAKSVAIGPGIGVNQTCIDKLSYISEKTDVPIIVDADAIRVFSQAKLKLSSRYILTPHLGEFSSLIGVDIETISKDRLYYAKKYAKEKGLILVLKGKNTIITDGDRTLVNTTGNEGMARGGMGDCLTGIIASLASRYEPFEAAYKGVYIHGLCGDEIYKESFTVKASELIKIIPKVMKLMYN